MNKNECDTPRVTAMKKILAYFHVHNKQATMIVGALSIGFVLAVFAVGYAMILQAKHGCLTFFMKNYDTKNISDV